MSSVKIWDNKIVHVVRGDKGVIISLPKDAANRLALLLDRRNGFPDLEGWSDLNMLREALDCLLVGDPTSTQRSLSNGYLTTLAENGKRA